MRLSSELYSSRGRCDTRLLEGYNRLSWHYNAPTIEQSNSRKRVGVRDQHTLVADGYGKEPTLLCWRVAVPPLDKIKGWFPSLIARIFQLVNSCETINVLCVGATRLFPSYK